MTGHYYAGLMSGTSLDAVDVAIADFDGSVVNLIAASAHEYPASLRQRVTRMIAAPARVGLDELGAVHTELGQLYGAALTAAMAAADIAPTALAAAGCHGQTVRHSPDASPPFTLQLGCGAAAAVGSGVVIVNDFRSADMALGGQGAPLVPAFHQAAFSHADTARVIVNLGGIANITVLQPGSPVRAWDTGPGNTLLDGHCRAQQAADFDTGGQWAASGTVDTRFLQQLLADPYFGRAAPKSTGREYFNESWVQQHCAAPDAPRGADLQATLAELTAASIAADISAALPAAEVYLCGGGAANEDLRQRLAARLSGFTLHTSDALGIGPHWVEAAAFAWLARARMTGAPGNIPSATGAVREAILGAIHHP